MIRSLILIWLITCFECSHIRFTPIFWNIYTSIYLERHKKVWELYPNLKIIGPFFFMVLTHKMLNKAKRNVKNKKNSIPKDFFLLNIQSINKKYVFQKFNSVLYLSRQRPVHLPTSCHIVFLIPSKRWQNEPIKLSFRTRGKFEGHLEKSCNTINERSCRILSS